MKSNVSDLLLLVESVYRDASAKCVAEVSDLRDLETIGSRVKSEGISFLTITLPQFCSDFERSLQEGGIDSKAFQGFRKARAIPAFLQGMLSRLFDYETGRMINDYEPLKQGFADSESSTIVEAVRQVCLLFKKVEIPCTPERTGKALDAFVKLEQSFEDFQLQNDETANFMAVSHVLWDHIVSHCRLDELVPHHGPGATAEGSSGNQKFRWHYWHDRLEPYFPLVGFGYPLGTEPDSEELEMVQIVSREREQPVKVTPVPKTLKSPRIIAIEPSCMQFVQQGIRDWLYRQLESDWLTRGHINFRDQTVNQSLALDASSSGRFATIDLSDASDRVPRDLALGMFSSHPDLRDAIEACRSDRAELPDGRLVAPLRKFASMGSALCFPVEAMYFYTICVMALLREHNLPATPRTCFNVSRGVYVYGDDIIVPTTNATTVLGYLQKYHCKVNTKKTFTSGSFRESCGMDAFEGMSVTPTYIRQMPPLDRHDARSLVSWVASSNDFYKRGYWRTAWVMRKRVNKILGDLPYVSETSPALGYTTFLGSQALSSQFWSSGDLLKSRPRKTSKVRWSTRYQRLEMKTWVPEPVYRADELEGYSALAKSLMVVESKKNTLVPAAMDEHHLERYALHGAVTLKRRWVDPLS